jgi:hypothetical protein
MQTRSLVIPAAVSLAVAQSPAFAALDVAGTVTAIGTAGTSVETVLAAFITVAISFVVYRLIRKAMGK